MHSAHALIAPKTKCYLDSFRVGSNVAYFFLLTFIVLTDVFLYLNKTGGSFLGRDYKEAEDWIFLVGYF